VPILEEGTNELDELQPPEELEEDWDRAMEINREQLDTVRELQTAVEEGDQARIAELLQEAEAAREESNQLASDLGLEECGSEASGP
jgi:gamma-glutamyl:cysteine ligase YbdK (ATP-grasp superfamily)